jgi:aminocarboxymuconate-semialdehyde decarboxylase
MDTIVLDVHAHLVPVTLDLVSSLSGVTWDAQSQAMMIDGHLLATKSLFQADVLLAWMDMNTIGHAWISIPPPAYRQALDEIGAREWAVYVNDGLASIAAKHPDRLSALLHLPVEHPVLAVEVVRNGARKFAMSAGAGPNVWLSDPVYEPLWKALDEQAAFLFIHPGTTCDPRLDKYFLRNLFGNPTETGVAATHLAISGVMSRFARMTVCLAHGGGVVPAIAARVQHGWAATDVDQSGERPSDAFRRFCVDCITHSASALRHAADVFGEDHVYFGSDWPFPMGLMEPHVQLATLNDGFRKRLFSDNPKQLLNHFACTAIP